MSTQQQLAAQTVEAEFQIGQVRIPINQITITHTIDELPHATISVQLDNDGSIDTATKKFGAVAMNIDKFNALTKATQEKILNSYRVEADTQIVVRDGEFDLDDPESGHELRLKGFLGRPEFRIREGEVFLYFSMVHAKAVMQAFNARIYGAQELYSFIMPRQFFDLDADGQKVIKAKSVADRIRIIIQGMVQKYVPTGNLVDSSKYDTLPLHNLNLTVLSKIIDFLKLSSVTTQIDDISEPDFVNDNLLWAIWNVLIDSPNFFQAIAAFNEDFMFQMNADYEGSAWLEWSQVNTDPGKREITVPIQNVVFSMANIFQLPVLQVLVQANGMDKYALSGDVGVIQGQLSNSSVQLDSGQFIHNAIAQTGDVNAQLVAIARYPASIPRNAVGVLYLISPPNWLNPELASFQQTSDSDAFFRSQEASRSLAMLDALNIQANQMAGAAKTRDKVMRYMAKQQFKKLYLEGTTGQVAIPLNLRVRPGYMYKVASVTGETLFTGYLVSAIHDVILSADGAAAATTTLAFTHIQAPGVVINALQDPPKFITATLTLPSKFTGDANVGAGNNLA